MKCQRCGTENEGNFCIKCGAQINEPAAQQAEIKPQKKKKPFFFRWWFILLVILTVIFAVNKLMPDGEKINWDDIVLGEMLPEPPNDQGEIHENTAESLRIDIGEVTDKEYASYIESCKEKGFTVDAKSDSSSYTAYNSKGYKLSASIYSSSGEMSIDLEPPMEMTDIKWPTSVAGKIIPMPKSKMGKFDYEDEDGFAVHIGNMTKAEYDEYVEACAKRGFTVDYSKDDDYYYADNNEGWHIDLNYEGNNVMRISVDAPDEETDDSDDEDTDDWDDNEADDSDAATDSGKLGADFKAAMDSYEEFMDEYVEFMKKYNKNPNDYSLMMDYADYMSEYAEFVDDFAAWEDEEMNAAETAYYFEVQSRVNKKLLEVAN